MGGSIVTLSWRNIWRNPRRTLLTLGGISMAVGLLIFFMSLQLSVYDLSIETTTSLFTGHLQVQPPGYQERPELRKRIPQIDDVLETVRSVPGVVAASPRGSGFALVSSDARSYGVQIIGVDPAHEPAVSSIPGGVKVGRYLIDEPNEAVVGATLARNLRVAPGAELTLLGQGADGSLASGVLKVVGISNSGSAELDRLQVHISLRTFQELFALPGAAHLIVVKTTGVGTVSEMQPRLASATGSSLAVLRWDEVIPGLKQAIDLDLAAGRLFQISLVIIVSFSVLNTFLMSVMERTREFAVLLALGMRPEQLARLVLVECGVLTVVGTVIGCVGATLVVYYYHVNGFYMPGAEEVMKHWNLPTRVPLQFLRDAYIWGPGVVFAASLLAMIWPVRRIFKMPLVTSLRG